LTCLSLAVRDAAPFSLAPCPSRSHTVRLQLAERAIVQKAVDDARRIARKNFRRRYPPRYWCTKCIRAFTFERELQAHWHVGCEKKDMTG
jgi:hypothetical protein